MCHEIRISSRDMWPSMVTILRICALHLTPPSAQSMLWCPGSSWGFGALKGLTSDMVSKVERTLVIHSPHRQFLPDPRFEPTTSGYKSEALSIRPRLHFCYKDCEWKQKKKKSLQWHDCHVSLMGTNFLCKGF